MLANQSPFIARRPAAAVLLLMFGPAGLFGQGFIRYQVAGQAVASQFAWRVQSEVDAGVGLGVIHFDTSALTLPDGQPYEPWSVGTGVRVADGARTETVTLLTSTCAIGGTAPCQATANFQYAHSGRSIVESGSDGLQEAIGHLGTAGDTVVLTPDWQGGGAQIAAAVGSAAVEIVDRRAGAEVWYAWNGQGYQPSAAFNQTAGMWQARNFETILHADRFSGADAGAQINACLLALPPNGGVCDARGIVPAGENAAVSENMFAGVSAPFQLLLGPYTLVVSAPQDMTEPGAIRGEGPQSLIFFKQPSGTLLTVNYAQGSGLADLPMTGLFSLYIDGPGGNSHPGGPTPTVGVQLGPVTGTSTGAAGFTLDHVAVRQFGTNVQLGNNAFSIRLSHDFLEDAGTALLLPAGTVNTGEMISLTDDFVADSGYGAQILAQGYELEAVNCSFDFNGTAVSMVADSMLTTSNTHWENLNLQPFISASAGTVAITGGQFVSDAASGVWPSYIVASGTASVSVHGAKVNSFGSTLQSFVAWSGGSQLSLWGLNFDPVPNVLAAASSFGPAAFGLVSDPAARQITAAAGFTNFGPARLASEGLGASVARNGVTVATQGNRTVLQWQMYGRVDGPYLATDPARPTTLILGAGGADRLTLDGTGNLVDTAGTAAFQTLTLGGGTPLASTNQTGSGPLVLQNQPALASPALATPTIGGGATIHQVLRASAALSFTALSAQTCQDQTLSVPQATPGAGVSAAPGGALGNGNLVWSAWIGTAGQATIRLCNVSATAVTPAAVNWSVWVIQ